MHVRGMIAVCLFAGFLIGCEKGNAVDVGPPAKDQKAIPPELAEDFQLCERWAALKNAEKPEASALLESLNEVPKTPLSQKEADRFEANWYLHQKNFVDAVEVTKDRRIAIVIRGSVSGPTLQVKSDKGTDRVQRTMYHPDVIVEVRKGKICGITAKIHSDR